MLTNDEPDVDFVLALGADAFVDLASGRWGRTEDVFRMVGRRMVVFRRASSSSSSSSSGVGAEDDDDGDDTLRGCAARWSRPVVDGDDDGRSSSSSSIRIVRVPTLSGVSSSAARASADVAALGGMLSVDVLDYVRRHGMYAFAEGGGGGRRGGWGGGP
jgi:hypothetical protein